MLGVRIKLSMLIQNSVDSATYYYKVVAVNAGGESSKFEPLTVAAKVTLKRQMEKLDRGINAVKAANGVLVSWRLLGTEAQNLEFDVYRDNVKINSKPIKSSTNYLDATGTTTSKYYVRTVGKNQNNHNQKQLLRGKITIRSFQ